MMRTVNRVVFLEGTHTLWGRRISCLRAQDGYRMRYWPESGALLIVDAKETQEEVVVHASRCDIYLEPETPAEKPAVKK